MVEFLARYGSDRLRSIDIFCLFQSIGRQLERPGKENDDRQTGQQEHDKKCLCPVGQTQRIADRFNNLNDQPRDDDIRHADAEYISPFQLLKEFRHTPVLLPDVGTNVPD